MTWWRATWAVLFSPILIGSVLFVSLLLVWKLPTVFCGRLRVVRYLPVAGVCYYSVAVSFAAVSLGLVWWEVSLLAGFAVLGGEWLLPDPVSFLLRTNRRRAVVRAIEYVEQQDRVLYGMVWVVDPAPHRQVVSVAIESGFIPPNRRFVAVTVDGCVEELDFRDVVLAYSLSPWF